MILKIAVGLGVFVLSLGVLSHFAADSTIIQNYNPKSSTFSSTSATFESEKTASNNPIAPIQQITSDNAQSERQALVEKAFSDAIPNQKPNPVALANQYNTLSDVKFGEEKAIRNTPEAKAIAITAAELAKQTADRNAALHQILAQERIAQARAIDAVIASEEKAVLEAQAAEVQTRLKAAEDHNNAIIAIENAKQKAQLNLMDAETSRITAIIAASQKAVEGAAPKGGINLEALSAQYNTMLAISYDKEKAVRNAIEEKVISANVSNIAQHTADRNAALHQILDAEKKAEVNIVAAILVAQQKAVEVSTPNVTINPEDLSAQYNAMQSAKYTENLAINFAKISATQEIASQAAQIAKLTADRNAALHQILDEERKAEPNILADILASKEKAFLDAQQLQNKEK